MGPHEYYIYAESVVHTASTCSMVWSLSACFIAWSPYNSITTSCILTGARIIMSTAECSLWCARLHSHIFGRECTLAANSLPQTSPASFTYTPVFAATPRCRWMVATWIVPQRPLYLPYFWGLYLRILWITWTKSPNFQCSCQNRHLKLLNDSSYTVDCSDAIHRRFCSQI